MCCAMWQHVIRAPSDGVIAGVLYVEGDFVDGGKLLVTFQDSGKKDKPVAATTTNSKAGQQQQPRQ